MNIFEAFILESSKPNDINCQLHKKTTSSNDGGSNEITLKVISRLVSLTFHALTHQLTNTAGRFGGFTGPSFRWFFESTTVFHFPEQAFALHFLL